MPRLMTDDMTQHALPASTFGFSAVKVEKLGATQYTLATVVVDESGSVEGFQDELGKCLWAVAKACQLSPQADNILLRVVAFSDAPREVHGFVPLAGLQESDYLGAVKPNGTTALHETIRGAIQATREYAKTLGSQDYDVNAALFFLTDGLNNHPPESPKGVRDALRDAAREETLGAVTTVLVGINDREAVDHNGTRTTIGSVLESLRQEAGLTQYVGLADATPKSLARLGAFISRSISSSSQAVATGGAKSAPPPVTF